MVISMIMMMVPLFMLNPMFYMADQFCDVGSLRCGHFHYPGIPVQFADLPVKNICIKILLEL